MNESFQPKPQNELDIVGLFEYFKNGIKAIFKGIANVFIWIFNQILNLLYLVFKNWVLVLSLMLLFGLSGLYKKAWLGEKFKYEMIVSPQFDSAFELYNHISGLNSQSSFESNQMEGLQNIQEFEIMPVKSYEDEVELYYSITKNNLITGAPDRYAGDQDTIFYRTTDFQDFRNELSDEQYPVQRIVVRSKSALEQEKLRNLILQPFNKDYWQNILILHRQRLNEREKITRNSIAMADSLLIAYARNSAVSPSAELNITGNSAQTNVEVELINQIKGLSDLLEVIDYSKNNAQEIIIPLSDIKRVGDDSMRSYLNLWTGLLMGFVLAMIILLLKYLFRFFRNYQIR